MQRAAFHDERQVLALPLQQAQIAELTTLIDEMEKRVAAVNEVRQSAAQITQRIKDNQIPDYPKLRKALDALGQVTAMVSSVSATVKSIVASVKKLKAA